MVDVQSSCKKFLKHKISLPAHINEHGGERHMANKNNSNQPTNAAEVRKQNQQSTQKTSTSQGSNYNTEFGAEFAPKTNATEVRNQNQQSAQKATQPQGGMNNRSEFGAEFASQTNPTEVKKQNQQSAQKASNRNNNSTK